MSRETLALQSALLCRRVVCDVTTSEHTLVDVVLALTLPVLPAVEGLQAYVCLTGVAERLRLRLELGLVGASSWVFRGELTVDSPDSTFPYQRVLAVASPPFRVQFSAPGSYELRVYQADRLLGAMPLMVQCAE
jgi:hypothetical protein